MNVPFNSIAESSIYRGFPSHWDTTASLVISMSRCVISHARSLIQSLPREGHPQFRWVAVGLTFALSDYSLSVSNVVIEGDPGAGGAKFKVSN